MKCPECGNEITAGEQFCGNCGAPVENPEQGLPDHEHQVASDETVISEAPVIPDAEPPLARDEPDFAPPPPPPAAPAAADDGKKRTRTIVAIVVAVIVLLCCCCLVALAVLLMSDAGQDLLRELDLAMRPLLTSVV